MLRRQAPPYRLIRHRWARDRRINRIAPAIRHARLHMETGEFEQASRAFIQLGLAARRKQAAQAPFLIANAARAQLELGNGDRAFHIYRQALSWLRQDQRWYALRQFGNRSADALEAAGYHDQAEQLREYVAAAPAGREYAASCPPTQSKPSRNLPEKCPYCGATVRMDFLQLMEDGSTLCSYCGSRIAPA